MGNRARRRARAVRMTEATAVDGMTFQEISDKVGDAIEAKLGIADTPMTDVFVQDISDTWVVYQVWGGGEDQDGLWQLAYTMADDGTVTLTGDPVQVKVTYATESRGQVVERIAGRLLESRDDDPQGRRVFRVQIIESGTSQNGNRYPQPVLAAAVPLYEGAKAFDHHRTDLEKKTSTISGLVGEYRDVAANTAGLEGDLVLLPGATHTAEALDASLAAQAEGRQPLIGISHDILAHARMVPEGARQFREATQIVQVHSADVVADPSAGGRALRMVAGGIYEPITPKKGTETMDLKQLLALLRAEADSAKRAELLTEHKAILDAAGLTADDVTKMITETPDADAIAAQAKADQDAAAAAAKAKADADAKGKEDEPLYAKDSILGRQLVNAAVTEAKLSEKAGELIKGQLPERFTESAVSALVENVHALMEAGERAGLTPQVPRLQVGEETRDKQVAMLDAFFQGDFQNGFKSFKEAFFVISGINPYSPSHRGQDLAKLILRESIGDPNRMYDSGDVVAMAESATTATWSFILGDSVTRRMVADYKAADNGLWKRLVSSSPPINDFRTQRIDRVGGYGTLPVVAQGAPYQPLTTPGDEEASYAITKRGGTEDLTLETIANDDVRLISKIPTKLALAAAQTLFAFVFDFLVNNTVCSYDSVALFASGHGNTTAVALSNGGYTQLRAKMRRQTGFGDTSQRIELIPATMIVPVELEDIGNQICNGRAAVPATTPGPTDVPNLAEGTQLLTTSYLADTNDWFLAADPANVPLLEVGFYLGREDPELFTQTDPTQGAPFNADKQVWKIRHIYGGHILDHRGLQRATQ